jgi:hypothetical protein
MIISQKKQSSIQKEFIRGVLIEGQYIRDIKKINPVKECKILKEAGANTLFIIIYETYYGKLFYKSDLYPELMLDPNRDIVAEYLDAAISNNLNVWFWCTDRGVPKRSMLAIKYKDSICKDATGKAIIPWNDPAMVSMCPNSPWREFIASIYMEVLKKYDEVDGIIISDMPGQSLAAGYCKYCKEKFKKKYGQEPPKEPDWNNPESLWWKFIWEKTKWWTEYINYLSNICKEIKPHIKVGINANPGNTVHSIGYGLDFWEISNLKNLDYLITDCWAVNEHVAWHKYCASLGRKFMKKNKKASFLILGAQFLTNPYDLKGAMYDAIISGCDGICVNPLHVVLEYPDKVKGLSEAFHKFQEVEQYLMGSEEVKFAAILIDKSTWCYSFPISLKTSETAIHGTGISDQYLRAIEGTYLSLILNGIPTDFIFTEEINNKMLSMYKVLIIPRPFCISSEVIQSIKNFLVNGGGVFITDKPGWLSPGPEKMRHFWREILGVDRIEGEIISPFFLSLLKTHPIVNGFDENILPIDYWPQMERNRLLLVPLEDTQIIANFSDRGGKIIGPAIFSRQYGSGRIIYSLEPLGLAFDSWMKRGRGQQHSMWKNEGMKYALLIANSVKWLAKNSLPFIFEAPQDTFVSLLKNEDKYIIAMVNHNYNHSIDVKMKLKIGEGQRILKQIITTIPATFNIKNNEFSLKCKIDGGSAEFFIID